MITSHGLSILTYIWSNDGQTRHIDQRSEPSLLGLLLGSGYFVAANIDGHRGAICTPLLLPATHASDDSNLLESHFHDDKRVLDCPAAN